MINENFEIILVPKNNENQNPKVTLRINIKKMFLLRMTIN